VGGEAAAQGGAAARGEVASSVAEKWRKIPEPRGEGARGRRGS